MIYTGLKDWERALHFYDIVIMSPTNGTASMIQVEAYKKRVLVGILAEGGVSSPSIDLLELQLTMPHSHFQCRRLPIPMLPSFTEPLQRRTTRLQRSSTDVLPTRLMRLD